jgi:hypothetical protein
MKIVHPLQHIVQMVKQNKSFYRLLNYCLYIIYDLENLIKINYGKIFPFHTSLTLTIGTLIAQAEMHDCLVPAGIRRMKTCGDEFFNSKRR